MMGARAVGTKESNTTTLVAKTTFKVEAMRYVENLYAENNPINDRSGWELLLSRDFENELSSNDVLQFVEDVEAKCVAIDNDFRGFDKAHVCASLFTSYRCTIDDCMLGFIVKTKTVVEPKTVEKKWKWHQMPFRFAVWLWRGFKSMYNGTLEKLKIR